MENRAAAFRADDDERTAIVGADAFVAFPGIAAGDVRDASDAIRAEIATEGAELGELAPGLHIGSGFCAGVADDFEFARPAFSTVADFAGIFDVGVERFCHGEGAFGAGRAGAEERQDEAEFAIEFRLGAADQGDGGGIAGLADEDAGLFALLDGR